jgi:cytochrome c oxidase assembly factor CtaG
MSLRSLALDWSLDGPVGVAFAVLVAAAGAVYVSAAVIGRRRDRRHRRWPPRRTCCFLAGLLVLVIDLYSGIGTEADSRLSAHMVEHMVMWVVVAPLLAAGAPVRLALCVLARDGRRRLGRWLRSPAISALTGPVGSVSLFSGVLLLTHVPAIYGLALRNDYVHEAEHALYLISALLLWAPLVGADPLPHRPGPRGQVTCMLACMLPMSLIALWLLSTSHPVYGHYVGTLGPAALRDQRLAAAIMLVSGLPAFAVPALARVRLPSRRRAPVVQGRQAPA